ncbi:decarboxylase [Candidatus Woesearchaeota archaeon CG10_big_fil_rev_8_21_14_0_10_37_12]|nr:MAG: decarboxylase [Candidatus Woesearchaeota archaeon CG10_big_fil_rev_8_21_14_0_10_37_12]
MQDKARFILSKSKVLEQLNQVSRVADAVSYSLKTNYEVGKVLEETADCLFSVHSIEALNLLKDTSYVWFFCQAIDDAELDYLFNRGKVGFVVDNEVDLNKLLKFCEKHNKKIKLLLRMRLKEHTVHTGKHFVFGFYSFKVKELVEQLKANKNIDKLGVHVHRKTQNVSEWSLKEELSSALGECVDYIDLLNIGGGIPHIYKNYRAGVLEHIFEKIKELKLWANEHKIDVIVEPGRFIAAPAVKLEAEIKTIYDANLVINCSVYNAAMDTFIANIRLLVEGELEKGTAYTIKGCTPDSLDIFRYRVFLKDPKVGDKIVFLNAGAYNFSTDFCKLPKIETKVVP